MSDGASDDERVKIEIDDDAPPKTKKKKTAKAKTVRATKAAAGGTSAPTPRAPKKPSAWTGDEDWAMFKLVHPKAKVDWAAVALAVGNGRDAKSCSNRYYAWSKKLEAAIKSMGV
ncbi:hypothetical protein Q8F55_005236 [Vanrija albida]|uniref:Myb-like domain-containing protein n=1 Tax=Vanrija albida TaxID=181172 RepID=A0ABR3Q129_9TREE